MPFNFNLKKLGSIFVWLIDWYFLFTQYTLITIYYFENVHQVLLTTVSHCLPNFCAIYQILHCLQNVCAVCQKSFPFCTQIFNHFWPLLKRASFFEAAGEVVKIDSSLKSNPHYRIKPSKACLNPLCIL